MERINNKRYDSRYNSEFKERIAELIEYILNKKYGEIITHKEASNILKYNIEIEKEFKRYQAQMIKIKNFLIDYGYMLKAIAGVGYYILTPKQIAGHCYRTYILKTQRLLEKIEAFVENQDQSEVLPHESVDILQNEGISSRAIRMEVINSLEDEEKKEDAICKELEELYKSLKDFQSQQDIVQKLKDCLEKVDIERTSRINEELYKTIARVFAIQYCEFDGSIRISPMEAIVPIDEMIRAKMPQRIGKEYQDKRIVKSKTKEKKKSIKPIENLIQRKKETF